MENSMKTCLVRFRGETYRITLDVARALKVRGFLQNHAGSYYIEDDPYLHVRGEPIEQREAA